MDIEYLLLLQSVRESFGVWLTTLVELVTKIPTSTLSAIIPAILFWCVSKRAGLFLLGTMSFGRLGCTLIKDTFCVYRPWILDSAIHPAASALKEASSFSFPSGHTQFTASLYGGLAYLYRKKFPQLIIPCAAIVLAVAFSRNFLGVHTLADVLTAILVAVAVMIVAEKIFDAVEQDRRLGVVIFFALAVLTALAAVYMLTKNYPVDYLYGKIIVTPERARLDSIDSIGVAAGFLIGWAAEFRFVRFSVQVTRTTKIRRMIIGSFVGGTAMVLLFVLKHLVGAAVYAFCKGFVPLFAIIFLAPLAFNYVEKRRFR